MSMWDSIKSTVAGAAPLLGSALGGPAGGAVGSLIANALGVEESPDAIQKAMQSDPEAAAKLQALQNEHQRELRSMVLEAETARLGEVNETYRKEIGSEDGYVRRMRPTYGYILALTLLIEAGIAVYVAGWRPGSIGDLATLYNALAVPQSVALGVLGVYVNGRTKEKMAGSGASPKGLLSSLFSGSK